jgi:pyruvate kinase
MMAETCFLAESAICYPPLYDELRACTSRPIDTVETVAMSAVGAAIEQNAGAILVLSTSGNTARLISKYRPNVPIITGRDLIYNYALPLTPISQSRGINKLLVRFTCTVAAIHSGIPNLVECLLANGRQMLTIESGKYSSCLRNEELIRFHSFGLKSALELRIIKPGEAIVAVQGWRQGSFHTNTMRILTVPTDQADLVMTPLTTQ